LFKNTQHPSKEKKKHLVALNSDTNCSLRNFWPSSPPPPPLPNFATLLVLHQVFVDRQFR